MPKVKSGKTSLPLFSEERFAEDLTRIALKAGIPRPQKPSRSDGSLIEPVLPPDLTVLTDEALGRLFSEFALCAQWAQLLLATYAVKTATKKRADKMTRAQVRLEKSGTNQDKEAKVELDPRTSESSYKLLLGEALSSLTDATLQGYLIGRDACSREMTRRAWAREPRTLYGKSRRRFQSQGSLRHGYPEFGQLDNPQS